MLDLYFRYAVRRDDPTQRQWQAYQKDGERSALFILDEDSALPEAECITYLCRITGEKFVSPDGRFKIITVELVTKLPSINGESHILNFSLEKRSDGKGLQWQAQEKKDGITFLFVPCKDEKKDVGESAPGAVYRWEVKPNTLVYRSHDGRFRIYAVQLVKEIVSARTKRRRARQQEDQEEAA